MFTSFDVCLTSEKMCGFCRSGGLVGGLVCSMLYVIKYEIIYLHLRFCVNICMYLYTVSTFTCIYMYTLCIYEYILKNKIIPHILIHPTPTLSDVFCWLPRSLVAYTSSSSFLKAVFAWGEKCARQAKTHESWKKEQKNQEPLIFPLVVQVCVILLIWVVVSFLLFSPLFGEDSHFDKYFSKRLKPPTTNW